MSLCDYCRLAGAACPAWPQETSQCVEFRPRTGSADQAALVICADMDRNDERRWQLLVRTLDDAAAEDR